MKKVFAVLMVAASILAVSCGGKKDNGSIDNGGGGNQTDPTLPASLQGSEYFPIILDSQSAELIKNKIVCDFRPDDTNKYLEVWPDGSTYAAGAGAGVNFYGNTEGYVDLVCQSVGWSGAGFCIKNNTVAGLNKLANIAADPAHYYLHIGYKGKANEAHQINFIGTDGQPYAFAIGQGSVDIDGKVFNAVAPTDGAFEANEWVEYEYSIQSMGVNFAPAFPAAGQNIFTFLSGNNPGREICLDAVFIYKK